MLRFHLKPTRGRRREKPMGGKKLSNCKKLKKRETRRQRGSGMPATGKWADGKRREKREKWGGRKGKKRVTDLGKGS